MSVIDIDPETVKAVTGTYRRVLAARGCTAPAFAQALVIFLELHPDEPDEAAQDKVRRIIDCWTRDHPEYAARPGLRLAS
jgi:hypothetical protein